MAAGVLWRINDRECDYGQLDLNGAEFSTKGLNLSKHNVTPGTLLFVVASGKSRARGLLGIWEVTADPFIGEQDVGGVAMYTDPFKRTRMMKQWRVTARLIRDVHTEIGDNLEYVFTYTSSARYLKNFCPTVLSVGEVCNIQQNYAE